MTNNAIACVARPPGRAVFYHRDSGGKHETTPAAYVAWAAREAGTSACASTARRSK